MEQRKVYGVSELLQTIRYLHPLFDTVRLVDPHNTAVLLLHEDGRLERQPEKCFAVWGKSGRCENCISIRTAIDQKRHSKLESKKLDHPFLVVSCPVELALPQGKRSVVLELVTPAVDSLLLEDGKNRPLQIQLSDAYHRIYGDVLTAAYNRRYLDEFNFLYRGAEKISREVALLVLDITKFKHINDVYGHSAGDEVLRRVVTLLQQNIRAQDSVIRMGGDEFAITLVGCKEQTARRKAEQIKRLVSQLRPDCIGNEPIEVDVGYAYTSEIDLTGEQLAQLIQTADRRMYRAKNSEK